MLWQITRRLVEEVATRADGSEGVELSFHDIEKAYPTCQALARVFRVVKQIVLVARARVHICFCCTRWAVFPVYPCA